MKKKSKLLNRIVILMLLGAFLGGVILYVNKYQANYLSEPKVDTELGYYFGKYPKFNSLYTEFLKKNSNMKPSSIKLDKETAILPLYETRGVGYVDPYDMRWMFSPDKSKAISTYMLMGEPDSSLEIYNRNDNKHFETLFFCGSPCSVYGAIWLDNDNFVFIWDEYTFSSSGKEGRDIFNFYIDIYRLKENQVKSFKLENLTEPLVRPTWFEWEYRLKLIESIFFNK